MVCGSTIQESTTKHEALRADVQNLAQSLVACEIFSDRLPLGRPMPSALLNSNGLSP
jgi:hypothetical protein